MPRRSTLFASRFGPGPQIAVAADKVRKLLVAPAKPLFQFLVDAASIQLLLQVIQDQFGLLSSVLEVGVVRAGFLPWRLRPSGTRRSILTCEVSSPPGITGRPLAGLGRARLTRSLRLAGRGPRLTVARRFGPRLAGRRRSARPTTGSFARRAGTAGPLARRTRRVARLAGGTVGGHFVAGAGPRFARARFRRRLVAAVGRGLLAGRTFALFCRPLPPPFVPLARSGTLFARGRIGLLAADAAVGRFLVRFRLPGGPPFVTRSVLPLRNSRWLLTLVAATTAGDLVGTTVCRAWLVRAAGGLPGVCLGGGLSLRRLGSRFSCLVARRPPWRIASSRPASRRVAVSGCLGLRTAWGIGSGTVRRRLTGGVTSPRLTFARIGLRQLIRLLLTDVL